MASSGYVFSGPGYASDLASGKVSLNTNLSNAAEYSKFVPSGSVQNQNNGTAASVVPSSASTVDRFERSSDGLDMSALYDLLSDSRDLDVENRDWNAQQAAFTREFNAKEAQKQRDFSSSEAQKQRDYETQMSNTSYQRAVSDLKAAGLNPVLAVKLAGASTPSGSAASGSAASSSSASGNFNSSSSIVSAIINSATSMASKMIDFQIAKDQISKDITLGQLTSSTNLSMNEANNAMYRYDIDEQSDRAAYQIYYTYQAHRESLEADMSYKWDQLSESKRQFDVRNFLDSYFTVFFPGTPYQVADTLINEITGYVSGHTERFDSIDKIIELANDRAKGKG